MTDGSACVLPVDLVLGLFSSFLTAITFIGVLWSVGGDLVIDAFGLILAIPGYLVIAVVVYSILLPQGKEGEACDGR